MKYTRAGNQAGFTIIEVLIASAVLGILAVSLFAAYAALQGAAAVARHKSIATELATNQLEYLRSLPYDSLAVAGGAIQATSPLPATITKQVNGYTYTVKTSINYIDDAFDGCGSYPDISITQQYCRNYPASSGAPTTDLNPADYKIANIKVLGANNTKFAELDTQMAARVAETNSTTGLMTVRVIDSGGNAVSGAEVRLVNATVSPAVDSTDSSDSNGYALFYGLKPDSENDYVVSAAKANYSSITTIASTGSLTANYPSQKIFTQQSSSVTLVINPKGPNSLLIEAVDESGSPVANLKVYLKGGVKKYSEDTDTSYYYDSLTPTDVSPVTDASGFVGVQNLDPGTYVFCGDNGDQGCSVSGSTRYLSAAAPYGGTTPLQPIIVPSYLAASPPPVLFSYGGVSYYQKVRLVVSQYSNAPRLRTITPTASSATSGIDLTLSGSNLPCSSSPASCGTDVTIKNGAGNYTGSCITGTLSGEIICSFDFTGAAAGMSNITFAANGHTIDIPNGVGILGGVNVTP